MTATDPLAARSVVVPAISPPSSVACLRSLGRRGLRPIAVSEAETAPALRSNFCTESVMVPSPYEDLEAYAEVLLSLARRADVETVVPVRDVDVYALAKRRSAFGDHVGTPWPDLETLTRAQDRIELFEAAERVGVSVPETRLLDDVEEWDGKWIVKSRYCVLADEYVDCPPERIVDPPTTRYLRPGIEPDVETFREEMGHMPIAQEYVPSSDEYGFFAIYDHGEPLATFQHRQRRGYSYAGGASAFRESVRIPDLEAAGRAVLEAIDWHGVAMVEFLREDGEFKLMEVNPRFWSSLPFSVQAGADFPYYYWLLATGQADRIDHEYEAGLAGHLLRGELLYLRSILVEDVELVERPSFPSALADVAWSLYEHPRFDYLRADDLGPFVRDMRNAFDELRASVHDADAKKRPQEAAKRLLQRASHSFVGRLRQ
ncbi:carboxylate--amine ligase [Natrialbaceae archaeon A-gly3]